MDSARRHELQQNDLDAKLAGLPGFLKRHGSKVLLVVAFVLLGVAVARYRGNQAAVREQSVFASLATANNAISQLQRTEQSHVRQQMQISALRRSPEWAKLGDAEKLQFGGNPAVLLTARLQAENEVRAGVQGVIDNADPDRHAAALAGAWQAQGELYWQLATAAPVEVGPSTQPAATTQKSPAEYLSLSKQAYEHVLKNFPQQPRASSSARMSLAAIAETENDFTAARAHYQAVTDAADAPSAEKTVAAARLARLDELAKPVLIAAPLSPSTQPAVPDAAISPMGPMPMLPGLGAPMPPAPAAPTTAPATVPASQPAQ